MTRYLPHLLASLLIQCTAVLGFLLCARSPLWVSGKYVFLALAPVLLITCNTFAARTLAFRSLLVMNLLVALGVVVFIQVLGFRYFPGLVKDVMPFSREHAALLLQVTAFAIVACEVAAVVGWGIAALIGPSLRA